MSKQIDKLLDCLEFAHGAIMDAIGTEDGLDGSAGEAVLSMIEEQFTKHKRDFEPYKLPSDTKAPAEMKGAMMNENLIKSIKEVALTGILPDCDHVNTPTLLWLEDLVAELEVK